jgi:glycosyltransferase involved in cell wall biosynthesis
MATEPDRDVASALAARETAPTPVADPSAAPLRVLYIMHTAAAGGSAASLRFLIESFPPGTVEPIVVCPPGDASLRLAESGIRVFPIPGISMLHSIAGVQLRGVRMFELLRTVWFTRFGGRLRAILGEVRPDVVHLNERGMLHAARIAASAGCAVVMHARSVTDRETRWVHRFATRWIDRYVDRVVAIDDSVRWSMREVSRCEIVYNPLRPRAGASVRPSHPTKPDLVRVTFLSGLIPFKGIRDLMAAATLLRDRADIRFQIAGANSRPRAFHDSFTGLLTRVVGLTHDMERELRKTVRRCGLEQTVFLEGHVDDVVRLLDRTDVLVYPSHLNGIPRSVFESGALGIPAVVSLKDRREDILVDGETGLLVPERDPAALAAAIARLADDSELRQRLGENARRKYLAQFDPVRIGDQMLEIYRATLRNRVAALS